MKAASSDIDDGELLPIDLPRDAGLICDELPDGGEEPEKEFG